MQKKEVPLLMAFLAAVVLGAIYLHWASISATKQGEDDFRNFNSSEIKGVLVYVGVAHHVTGFKVNTSSKEFIFDPSRQRFSAWRRQGLEAQMLNKLQMFIRSTNAQFTTSSLLLRNRC